MNWRLKAAVQRLIYRMPIGKQALYRQLQRRCGGLVRGYDYSFLLSEAARMDSILRDAVDFPVDGATVMEVGTGWRVDMPIAFYLLGARRVVTCDLNRYLDAELALGTVRYVIEHEQEMQSIFPVVDRDVLRERIAQLRRVTTLDELFRIACIEYHAPTDCAHTNFADGTIDIHYSYTVFEHIAAPVLEDILREASRLLSPRGLALHHIDLGDHFAQVDPSITPANFLQFSEKEWDSYAGTPWSYHNRLRADDYERVFKNAGHEVLYWKPYEDERSLDVLRNGLTLAPEYRERSLDLLSVAILDVISRPRRASQD